MLVKREGEGLGLVREAEEESRAREGRYTH